MSQEGNLPYLTFSLAGECYAVPVERTAEVLEYARVTKLPMADRSLRGIIDLRGKGVPIVDLRIELGLDASVPEKDCSIVVLELPREEGILLVGALVDAVYEVIEVAPSSIESPPRFESRTGGDTKLIAGIAKADDRFVIVLDAERLFSKEALAAAEEEMATAV
jgi:purine-binding chemotaxis protein CheW